MKKEKDWKKDLNYLINEKKYIHIADVYNDVEAFIESLLEDRDKGWEKVINEVATDVGNAAMDSI